MRFNIVLLLAAMCVPATATATSLPSKAADPIDGVEIEEVVSTFANQLEANFAFPDVAKNYANRLRERFADGAYAKARTRQELAELVNADLQSVQPDKHLKIKVRKQEAQGEPQQDGPPEEFRRNGIVRSGWLADGVAYISFSLFPENRLTQDALRSFLEEHRTAHTLIIDAREHTGGGLAEMDVLFSRIYAEPVTLVHMETRRAVEERFGGPPDMPTLKLLDGPKEVVRRAHVVVPEAGSALANVKVILLTSGETGSAGEHFTLALKRTGRATVIGETTHGAGNFGGMIRTGEHFEAFVPAGRTFDPDTGKGWEGVGVAPHIHVPAHKALDEALKLAGVRKSSEEALASLD